MVQRANGRTGRPAWIAKSSEAILRARGDLPEACATWKLKWKMKSCARLWIASTSHLQACTLLSNYEKIASPAEVTQQRKRYSTRFLWTAKLLSPTDLWSVIEDCLDIAPDSSGATYHERYVWQASESIIKYINSYLHKPELIGCCILERAQISSKYATQTTLKWMRPFSSQFVHASWVRKHSLIKQCRVAAESLSPGIRFSRQINIWRTQRNLTFAPTYKNCLFSQDST